MAIAENAADDEVLRFGERIAAAERPDVVESRMPLSLHLLLLAANYVWPAQASGAESGGCRR